MKALLKFTFYKAMFIPLYGFKVAYKGKYCDGAKMYIAVLKLREKCGL